MESRYAPRVAAKSATPRGAGTAADHQLTLRCALFGPSRLPTVTPSVTRGVRATRAKGAREGAGCVSCARRAMPGPTAGGYGPARPGSCRLSRTRPDAGVSKHPRLGASRSVRSCNGLGPTFVMTAWGHRAGLALRNGAMCSAPHCCYRCAGGPRSERLACRAQRCCTAKRAPCRLTTACTGAQR